jgi:hypothetical protein
VKQTDVSGIYRDDNGALLNKDVEGLHAYKLKKNQSRRLDNLETELAEIKTLLLQLIRERNG